MDGDVALTAQQRIAQRCDENARATHLGQRPGKDIAIRADVHQLHRKTPDGGELVRGLLGLGERKLAGAGSNPDSHGCAVSRAAPEGYGSCPVPTVVSAPEIVGFSPRKLAQHPGRHTSYQGPRSVRAGRSLMLLATVRSQMRSTRPLTNLRCVPGVGTRVAARPRLAQVSRASVSRSQTTSMWSLTKPRG